MRELYRRYLFAIHGLLVLYALPRWIFQLNRGRVFFCKLLAVSDGNLQHFWICFVYAMPCRHIQHDAGGNSAIGMLVVPIWFVQQHDWGKQQCRMQSLPQRILWLELRHDIARIGMHAVQRRILQHDARCWIKRSMHCVPRGHI